MEDSKTPQPGTLEYYMCILELAGVSFDLTEVGLRCVARNDDSNGFLARLYICKDGKSLYGLCHRPYKAESVAEGGNRLDPEVAIQLYCNSLTELAALRN